MHFRSSWQYLANPLAASGRIFLFLTLVMLAIGSTRPTFVLIFIVIGVAAVGRTIISFCTYPASRPSDRRSFTPTAAVAVELLQQVLASAHAPQYINPGLLIAGDSYNEATALIIIRVGCSI